MLNKLKKRESGFTIIEVLIVLAIAGLILLIVFLAVPALQRNSRNTQRKNDVAAILGAFSEAVNNNAGKLPTDNADFQTKVVANAKLGTFEAGNSGAVPPVPGDVTYSKNSSAPSPAPTNTDVSKVVVQSFLKCDGNNATGTNATARSVVALYAVETSGGSQQICQEG